MKTEEFKERYGFPEWPVKFRPKGKRSTAFGLDNTYGKIRLHPAIDITLNRDGTSAYMYMPFASSFPSFIENAGVFGTMIIAVIDGADFEMRIMHFPWNELSATAKVELTTHMPIDAATYLGEQKTYIGKGTGVHIHVEYVSLEEESETLENLLDEALGFSDVHGYYLPEVYKYAQEKLRIGPTEAREQYETELKTKRIIYINDNKCKKFDYMDGYKTVRTWYNSHKIFNGL